MKNIIALIFLCCLSTPSHAWLILNDTEKAVGKQEIFPPIDKSTSQVRTTSGDLISEDDFQKAAKLLAEKAPCPSNLAGLTDGWDVFSDAISNEIAAEMNLFAKISVSTDDHIFLYHLMFYKDVRDADGYITNRCGAGIRLALSAKKIVADASLDDLPSIAASTQLNKAKVQYKIATFGLSGKKIIEAIPDTMQGSFDLDGHMKLFKAVDKIKEAIQDTTTVVTPATVKIRYAKESDEEYIQAMSKIWALINIKEGQKCSTAKKDFKTGSEAAIKAITNTYESVAEKCSMWEGQNNVAQLKAKNILDKFGYGKLNRTNISFQ